MSATLAQSSPAGTGVAVAAAVRSPSPAILSQKVRYSNSIRKKALRRVFLAGFCGVSWGIVPE